MFYKNQQLSAIKILNNTYNRVMWLINVSIYSIIKAKCLWIAGYLSTF